MAERCATCGNERPAGARGPCPTCLFGLGLKEREGQGPMPERLGAYEIVSRLGAGGMGEVYRAHDARLGRDVAIKVMPDALEGDPERLARFRREARLAASLNHPHIAGIYGFEDEDGAHFLVMELIEGTVLSELLRSGPLPIDEALAVVEQIAEGLEAAHERGVVHRDLKPSNIKITPSGQAKILDFGLAKAERGAAAGSSGTSDEGGTGSSPGVSAAITGQYTQPGTVFGTVPYMSPEQARGRAVDKRTDIWSLGCVLYECLSGRRAFDGDTGADVVGKILEREPDWDELPARTPPRVRELLARCLEKDPKLRVRDAGDVRIEIARAREAREWTSSGSLRVPPWAATGKARPLLPWAIAGLAVAVAAVVLAASFLRGGGARTASGDHASPRVPMRMVVTDPDVTRAPYEDAPTVAISPDGQTIAYVGKGPEDEGGWIGLYLRRAEEVQARRLDLPCYKIPAQPYDPIFSPDGRSIAFSCAGLYRMPLGGGPAVRLLESGVFLKGATWIPGGIVFSPAARAGLVLAREGGGPLETLTVPDVSKNEVSHRWPSALPDGHQVLFTIKKEGITSFDQGEIALLDLETRSYKTILRGGSFARWLPTGQVVFVRGSTIMAVAFDPRAEQVVGEPVPVTEGVMTEPGSGAAQYAAALDTGTLVLVPGGVNVPRNELVWIDRKGSVTPVGAPLLPYAAAKLSPDGTRLACTVLGATDTVVVYDLVQRSLSRLSSEGNCALGYWTPDGRQIVYGSDQAGLGRLTVMIRNADGSGGPRRFAADIDFDQTRLAAPLPEGAGLLYETNDGLWVAPLEGESRARRIGGALNPAHGLVSLSLSPDGRWLVYDSSASGQSEVYVRTFSGEERTWQITHGGAGFGRWSPRGGELFYVNRPARWMCSARVSTTKDRITVAAPVELFKVPADTIVMAPHPDGERFLAMRPVAPAYKGDRVEAVLHWSDQVAARAPGRTSAR